MTKIRKKPCAWCGKRLQAPGKLKWRNNLARHLQNCAPWQREWMSMTMHMVTSLVEHCVGATSPLPGDYQQAGNRHAEVQELERLYNKP